MKKLSTVIIAAGATALLTFGGLAAPALAAVGTTTCPATGAKTVSVWSVSPASNGNHYYAYNGTTQYWTNNQNVAVYKQTYSGAKSSGWATYANGPMPSSGGTCY